MAVLTEVGLLQSYLFFTLFYCVIIAVLVFPPDEFISAGITIENIFDSWLGSENVDFFQYQIRRTCLTLLLHALLPFGFVFGVSFVDAKLIDEKYDVMWISLFFVTLSVPAYVLFKIFKWSENNWEDHPISQQLKVFANPNSSWTSVAADINEEYRRLNKINLRLSTIVRVIATDNWILKVSPYKVNIAYQADSTLTVKSADMHQMIPIATEEVQFVNIEVQSTRRGVEPFTIRLNALDLKDLQDRVSRITIPQNIRLHKTLTDRFLDTFAQEVELNPVFETYEEVESCIGCMQVPANVKLQKLCLNSEDNADNCSTCYCKPMWCCDCMGRWFASRQEDAPRTWLSSKCTCPLCRAKFCILDVSKVVKLTRR